MYRARVVQLIKERPAECRCTLSNKLRFPMTAPDGKFYKQRILEADPSLELVMQQLKAKPADFSRVVRERYLRHPQEDILELITKCLSVFCPHAGTENGLRVLSGVEG
jgi:hypothetical protein